MHRERKIQGLRAALGQEKIRKGDEYVFLCPRCKHVKPKLSVNVEKDTFHCWVDNFKGLNLAPLLKGDYKVEYVTELKATGGDKKTPAREYDEVKLPKEFKTLTKEWHSPYYSAAVNYLKERGIGPEEIVRWKLGYCEDGEYKGRIIVPSFDEFGYLNFWVGRTFYDNPVKYKSGNFCKDIVWNDYQVDWNKPVTLVEGPFDAFKAGSNVVALQGTILHDKLLTKIVTSEIEVYVALDLDAVDKSFNIMKDLLEYGVTCHFVRFEQKDVGEMTTGQFREYKKTAYKIDDHLSWLRHMICNVQPMTRPWPGHYKGN